MGTQKLSRNFYFDSKKAAKKFPGAELNVHLTFQNNDHAFPMQIYDTLLPVIL